MQVIKTALENLNVFYNQINETAITAQVFGVDFTIIETNQGAFTLTYTANGRDFNFTNQPWKSKVKGKVKKGLFMFFKKIQENSTEGNKFYQVFPNYYLLSVKHEAPVPSMTNEDKLKLTCRNLQEEVISLRRINVELEKALAKERREVKDLLGVQRNCEQLQLDLYYRQETVEVTESEQVVFSSPTLEFA